MPLLAELYSKGLDHGLLMVLGNNVGYLGSRAFVAGFWQRANSLGGLQRGPYSAGT